MCVMMTEIYTIESGQKVVLELLAVQHLDNRLNILLDFCKKKCALNNYVIVEQNGKT